MSMEREMQQEVIQMNLEKDLSGIVREMYGKSIRETEDAEIYYAIQKLCKNILSATPEISGDKKVYYISAEFLIGKLLSNNLINLGIYDNLERILKSNGKELSKIEEIEPEPSLGNGGLGRLAACFLDSIASLGLPGEGIGLNYHFGLFKQVFRDKLQTAEKNDWIEKSSWLTKTDTTFSVYFGKQKVTSRLYDIDVIGYENGVNKLRLFDVESVDESLVKEGIHFDKEAIEKNLTLFLYPDDSDKAGNLLRIYQQYFMVSNAAQLILKEMKEKKYDLRKMYEHAVIQINDTHPTMVIPELIRILVDDKAFTMDEAIEVVSKTCAYTNHTIMSEALEKWPLELFSRLLPRIYQITEEINRRFQDKIQEKYPNNFEKVKNMAIIFDGQVKMAHLAIAAGFSVNGVARLHTEILKNQELKDFYEMMPEKFNNKTNGITQRRFLLHGNPKLARWVTDKIGDEWITDLSKIEKLSLYIDDKKAQQEFMNIKFQNKVRLANYIKEHNGVEVDPHSIFDVQVKRLHEYKRQLLNILHVMHLYNELKKNPQMDMYPRTFIFGAKASAGYRRAKAIIKLINSVADVVNNDAMIQGKLKVVFIENYRVSNAEMIFAAADVSEQISTASKEASGTGNMKFMLNGAPTLGTMDGANVEIVEEVGQDNAFIFGLSSQEVIDFEQNNQYNPKEIYNMDSDIRAVLTQLIDGTYSREDLELFRELYNSLLESNGYERADQYFILKDFRSYEAAQKRVEEAYKDEQRWARMAMLQTAKCGKFSSDRTIEEYAQEIWHLKKVKL